MSRCRRVVVGLVVLFSVLSGPASTGHPVLAAASGGTWACGAPDISSGCSNFLSPLPTPRDELAVVNGPDGRIYAIGGSISTSISSAVEAYDPTSGTWSTMPALPTARYRAGATTGPDGRIYVIGGVAGSSSASSYPSPTSTVEAYSPAGNSWTCSQSDTGSGCTSSNSTIAPLPTVRECPGVATGSDGTIYVIAGLSSNAFSQETDAYNTTTNTWSQLAPVPVLYVACVHAAQIGGKIYVLGPAADSSNALEIYDPTTNSWSAGASFPAAIDVSESAVTAGPDGLLYVLGGPLSSGTGVMQNTVYAYDPSTNTWMQGPSMSLAREYAGAATGSDGKIYLVGGEAGPLYTARLTGIVESYDPITNRWNDEPIPFAGHIDEAIFDTVIAMPNGSVYVVSKNSTSANFGVYSPVTNDWTDLASPPGPVQDGLMSALGADGHIYIFGNGGTTSTLDYTSSTPTRSIAEYDKGTNTWTCSTIDGYSGCSASTLPPMPTARIGGVAVADPATGLIYVIGGGPGSGVTGVMEAYDPIAKTWRCSSGDSGPDCSTTTPPLAPMPTPRSGMAAVLGRDGLIYVLGGNAASGVTSVVEAYDPTSNTWNCSIHDPAASCTGPNSTLSALPTARANLAAAISQDGTIYTFGGDPPGYGTISNPSLSIVEAYDPVAGKWTCSLGDTGNGCNDLLLPMPSGHGFFGAATLPDGRIETVGSDETVWDSLEIFTPPSTPTVARVSRFTVQQHGHALVARWWLDNTVGIVGFILTAGSHRLDRALIPAHGAGEYSYRLAIGPHRPVTLKVVLADGREQRVASVRV